MDLNKIRQQIDACDQQLAQVFTERMRLVLEVIDYKKQHKLPIFDPMREQQLLAKLSESLSGNQFHHEIVELFQAVLRISKQLQVKTVFPFNIVLIGFMGTGKSSVGNQLSQMLSMEFIDTDQLIQEQAGLPIPEIFRRFGEAYFRTLEQQVVQQVSEKTNTVISCGGGVVTFQANVNALKNTGKLILLEATPETIYERVHNDEHRPLLQDSMTMEVITSLLNKRQEFYTSAAHLTITTDGKTIEQICQEIIKALYA